MVLALILCLVAFTIFKERNPQKVDWVNDPLKGQGSPFLLHAFLIFMYLVFPMFVLGGALQYNFKLGYGLTFVIGLLVWALLDSSGHNLFQNRVAAPDNLDP